MKILNTDTTNRDYLSQLLESELGCTPKVYFDNVTLMSQKPCQYNNKFNCSKKKNG